MRFIAYVALQSHVGDSKSYPPQPLRAVAEYAVVPGCARASVSQQSVAGLDAGA